MNARRRPKTDRTTLCLGLLASLCGVAAAQTPIFDEPLSPRIANYEIKVTLDDRLKHLTGDVILTWNNPSDDEIEELQFHLYYNAFKNAKSTFIREMFNSRRFGSSTKKPPKAPWHKNDGWGWIRIASMTVDGADVTDQIEFHQPDDNNADDQSVIRVPLPNPIAPHATAKIVITYDARIPKCKRRSGWWQDDFFMMVHWFPKIGVYETPGMRFIPADAPKGKWNCHQFHAATEFYSDYGVYDVEITLPEKYVVGTSGLITAERPNGDGTKTVVVHAEDIHDFAWVADAQFREAKAIWKSESDGREISIRLLYQPGHGGVVNKYLDSTQAALTHVHGWLGDNAYPYPNITVIDPRPGSSAGGMEYPTLFTGGASWWMEQVFGDGLRKVEGVTIHEFMHQIWYGIVGSNEFEEAWLDEGLTTYSEGRISNELVGQEKTIIDWMGASLGTNAVRRGSYAFASSHNDVPMTEFTYAPWHLGVARNLAYNKTSLFLTTLENYLGRPRFDEIMKTYYQRWRFRHPCRDDFIKVANEVAGENLDWFFDQIIGQSISLDYAVAGISNVRVDGFEEGILSTDLDATLIPRDAREDAAKDDEDEEDEESSDDGADEDIFQSTVVFRRLGEVRFPMDYVIEFSDGEIVRDTWDGQSRVKTLHFTRPARIVRAAIDPDLKVPLDVDRFNNSKRIEPDEDIVNKYTFKGFFWLQSLLQFFSIAG